MVADPRSGLVLEDVIIALGGAALIDGLTLIVAPGEIVTVMGPSGSGKSTLLNHICGTLAPAFTASGRVSLNGRDLRPLPTERRHVGLLFQDDLLFPHMSVAGNLAFGLNGQVRSRTERAQVIAHALQSAGLAGYERRDPATLSGGERARVAVLRVLLSEPRALLLDEPFAKLDVARRQQFRRFVFDRARTLALPTLLVTHDPADAKAAGGAVIDISHSRPGGSAPWTPA